MYEKETNDLIKENKKMKQAHIQQIVVHEVSEQLNHYDSIRLNESEEINKKEISIDSINSL